MRTIQNDTGLELGYFWCQREPGEHRLTFVLKGTFTIAPGAQATMAAREARDPLSGDAHHDDGERLAYPSDFAPWKPRADVIVSGNAAAIEVGSLKKSSSDAREFDAIDRREPARACLAGTYDNAWLTKRWPALPADFDWGYFNAAPRDQQIDGYLAGDESMAIADMPDAAPLEAKLPGLRPRLFVRREAGDALPFEEVLLSLDTLWLGADGEKLVLVWRGSIGVRDKRFREVEQLLLATEPMAAEPLPRAHYAAEERWVSATPSEEELAEREEQAARAVDREDEEDVADDEAAVDAAREVLKAANASPALIAKLCDVRSIDELMAVLEREDAAPDVARAQAAEAEALRANRRFQEEHADELAALQDKAEQAPIGRLMRADVVARVAARESLRGLDLSVLDLSNLDLSGADLEAANLRGSSLDGSLLAGARLVGADLTGAWAASRPLVLTGADLTGAMLDSSNLPGLIALGVDFTRASLRGAKLAHAKLMDSVFAEAVLEAADLAQADLSRAILGRATLAFATLPAATLCECDFAGANLVKANLEHTTLDGVSFEHASLEGVSLHHAHGDGVSLRGAGLAAANAEDTRLTEADFGGASCDRASFDRAILRGASFERADGEGVSLRGATLTGLRATGASFPGLQADGAHAPGAIFCGADLAMASFVGATLDDADFSEANLTRARLHRAMLKNANLMSSKLAAADLTSVNLFRGQLEGADLTGTDCSGSNLFECELYEATLEGARFDGCNLKRTKLDAVERASTAVRSVA